ncbi:hypothetical protein LCGC14_1351050 [marine sediment metagenome]|uniref:Uncharacterized protein n=1 Tax=marine sediment metagenome TaxID=412755 RepID=A0A0F9ND66_9ZZZZ
MWLAALRGGKYEQGQDSLKTSDGKFCCLGVLCDLYNKSVAGKKRKAKWVADFFESSGDRQSNYLPKEVQKWAGIVGHNPIAGGKCLSHLNDASEFGFKRIADKIEKHL